MKTAKRSLHFTQLVLLGELITCSRALLAGSRPFSGNCRPSSRLVHGHRPLLSSSPLSLLGTHRHISEWRKIYAPPLKAAGSQSAESLFPSDDSDYESANRSNKQPSSSSGTINDSSSTSQSSDIADNNKQSHNNFVNPFGSVSDFFNFSEISHPTQQKLQVGPLIFIDPFDVIADWISEKFVEQSLQWNAGNETAFGSIITTENQTGYVIESYPPGSTLDAFAHASATLTPLSYQVRTIVRVMFPSILFALVGTVVYPSMAQWLVHLTVDGGVNGVINDGVVVDSTNLLYTDDVLTVVSNDLSQYIQNILTTCALLFGMLVGQTYYFMYQQQEMVFYALFAEVTEAKSLLEQISLMSYGRPGLYPSLLSRMNDYVQNDLKMLSVRDPTSVTSALPRDDPLESILYATSVGVPGVVYETVKSLRQARADRCGALQRKLPSLHIYCLRLLGVIVLCTFPVCGSGSQAIAPNVLILQSYMFGVLIFALTVVLNVVEELRNSRRRGAYNVDGVLRVMVGGLERELEERLDGRFWGVGVSPSLPMRSVANYGDLNDGSSFADAKDVAVYSDTIATSSRRQRLRHWIQRKVLRR